MKQQNILNSIAQTCAQKGLNLTPPRHLVLTALLDMGKTTTAYELIDCIGDIKPMTVYRALDFLTKNGFVHRIESLNAYRACAEHHCAHTDSQYLICGTCKNVEELHDHKLDTFITQSVRQTGFTPHHKTLEIHGVCAACRE